jgi:hypothetical protein
MRSSSSTARWYHGDFFDRPLALAAPPSFDLHEQQHDSQHELPKLTVTDTHINLLCTYLDCWGFLAMFCSRREWRNIWAGGEGSRGELRSQQLVTFLPSPSIGMRMSSHGVRGGRCVPAELVNLRP